MSALLYTPTNSIPFLNSENFSKVLPPVFRIRRCPIQETAAGRRGYKQFPSQSIIILCRNPAAGAIHNLSARRCVTQLAGGQEDGRTNGTAVSLGCTPREAEAEAPGGEEISTSVCKPSVGRFPSTSRAEVKVSSHVLGELQRVAASV